MDSKFILPIATMLGGLALWVAFLIWRAVSGGAAGSPLLEAAVCLLAGGLVVFSGVA
jgi:hypothetical protein